MLPLVSWGFWLVRSEGRRETHFLPGRRVTLLLLCSLSLSQQLGPQRCCALWKICTTSPCLQWVPGCLFPARTLTPPGGFGDGTLAMADPPRLDGHSQVRQGGGCPGVMPGARLDGAPTGAGTPLWGESMCAWSTSLGGPMGEG